jgi:hypothetical protein
MCSFSELHGAKRVTPAAGVCSVPATGISDKFYCASPKLNCHQNRLKLAYVPQATRLACHAVGGTANETTETISRVQDSPGLQCLWVYCRYRVANSQTSGANTAFRHHEPLFSLKLMPIQPLVLFIIASRSS